MKPPEKIFVVGEVQDVFGIIELPEVNNFRKNKTDIEYHLAPRWIEVTVSSEKPIYDKPIWFISYHRVYTGYRDKSGFYIYDRDLQIYYPLVTHWCYRQIPPKLPFSTFVENDSTNENLPDPPTEDSR